jgi:hypothetical protein
MEVATFALQRQYCRGQRLRWQSLDLCQWTARRDGESSPGRNLLA